MANAPKGTRHPLRSGYTVCHTSGPQNIAVPLHAASQLRRLALCPARGIIGMHPCVMQHSLRSIIGLVNTAFLRTLALPNRA
jgi:hypothetical protein